MRFANQSGLQQIDFSIVSLRGPTRKRRLDARYPPSSCAHFLCFTGTSQPFYMYNEVRTQVKFASSCSPRSCRWFPSFLLRRLHSLRRFLRQKCTDIRRIKPELQEPAQTDQNDDRVCECIAHYTATICLAFGFALS